MARASVELIVEAAKAINPLKRVAAETKKLDGATRDVNGRLRDQKGRFIGSAQGANQASQAFNGLGKKVAGLAAAYIGLNAAQKSFRAGVSRIESERRIEFLAKGYGEVAELQNAATKAAERFGTGQTEANRALADVFARLRPIGVELSDIVSVYNGFNTAARISGASAVESSNAFRQLSQALGSGALRGDEFNSISEQVPGILTAIAQESGVAQGKLRAFAAEGKITSDLVIRALKRIETEGAGQLKAALGGPAQAMVDFQNATEKVQVALTKDIVPELAKVFTGLAELIVNLEGPIRFIGGVAADTLGQINSLIAQATQPAAVAARRDIESGLIPTNLIAAFTGGDPRGGAKQLFGEAGLKELEDSAREFAKLRGQGFQEVLLQFMQDRLKTMDAAGLKGRVPPSITTQLTNTTLTDKDADKEAERLEQIAKSSAERVRSLKQQTLLASALTDEERKQFERQIQIADIIQNTKGFSEEQLRAELAATIALHEQQDATEAINKANEQRKKDADELAKKQKEQADEAAKQAKKLEDLYKNVGTAIENGIVNGIMGAIEGTKSLQESLADVLRDVGKLFLQFAVKTGLNAISPSVFPMAEGGYVSGPTNALIGEGGEPEYVIPESKMRTAMSRYSRGSRGSSVIPESGAAGMMEEGGRTAVAAPIDVRYTVERINSVDYVTADQFQAGMQQAATQGAKQGEQQTLKRLQMSGSTRKRIGI